MGLPTANKRKLGGGGEDEGPFSPTKQQCRSEDQAWIAEAPGQNMQKPSRPSRLEELASVAPPDWAAQRPALLTTLLDDDDEFDDEDFDDDEEEERIDGKYLPPGRTYSCRYSSSSEEPGFGKTSSCYEDQGYSGGTSPVHYGARAAYPTSRSPQYWGYPSCPPQQTIRCEENGKSYLELGPSPTSARNRTPSGLDKCCDAERTSWCRRAPETSCYRQRRLAVFNLSMCKLGRYRQFTDPSLLRSVLICNTLRYIEREMEQEGCFYGGLSGHATCAPPPPLPPVPSPAEVDPTFPPPQFLEVPDITPSASSYRAGPEFYEQSGRATPFPLLSGVCDADSGMGDDENARSINWGSVLSLSSQSDLDPMNNNELYSDSGASASSASAQDIGHEFDDFLPNWKLTPVSAEEVLKSASSDPVPPLPSCQIQAQDMELMQVLVSS
ncbi:UNVERIFIED_CONTAM: hypothetical protein PYX00_007193 [Menopon gallinae]|uniref:SERTA domain-containing protein n=1 Tax=Menopon gallinae TaxID=328185 RepID=A0AAW2HI15_9NEOP